MTINKRRAINWSLGAIAAIIFLGFLSRWPLIFQEGNPWPLLKGIANLHAGRQELVRLDFPGEQYLSRGNDTEAIKSFLESRGYDFVEQMGAGYIFESATGSRALAVHRYYSRHYSLWKLSFPASTNEAPAFSENERAWEEIKEAIAACRVDEVFQAHSLQVKAELKDGRLLEARESRIDEIIDLVTASGCRGVVMATE